MLEDEKQQLKDWEARRGFTEEIRTAQQVWLVHNIACVGWLSW